MPFRSDRILRKHLRTRFLITTKAGQTWDAVVLEVDDMSVLLAETQSVSPDGERTPAAGQVFIPRGDIAYMQRT